MRYFMGLLLCFWALMLLPVQAVQTLEGVNPSEPFSHVMLDDLLHLYVNKKGFVDFTALKLQPRLLNQYLGVLAKASPKTHPDLFPTWQDEACYWLNARMALTLRYTLNEYPTHHVIETPQGLMANYKLERLGGTYYNAAALQKELTELSVRHSLPFEVALHPFRLDSPPVLDEAFHPARLLNQLRRLKERPALRTQLKIAPQATCEALLITPRLRELQALNTKSGSLYFPRKAITHLPIHYPILESPESPIVSYCANGGRSPLPSADLLMDMKHL